MEVYKKSGHPYNNLTENLFNSDKSEIIYVYKNKQNCLYIDINELKIFLKSRANDEQELSFIEAVRFIDTRAEKNTNWKRDKILFIASCLGFFGV